MLLDSLFRLDPELDRVKSRAPRVGGAVGLAAGGREIVVGAAILLMVDGAEMEAQVVWVFDDATIQALPGPDILLGGYPERLDHLEFGRDWRWPSERPSPSTAA